MSAYRLPVILVPLLMALSPAAAKAHNSKDWGYHNIDIWGGICNSGMSQSPIDIDVDEAQKHGVEPLLFLHYDDPIDGFTMTNNGHTITLQLTHPCKIAVAGGGLRGFYLLDHIHFHWGSEHTLERRRFPAEVHLVHFNKIYGNVSEASRHPKGLAVVGIFLEEDNKDNEALEPVLLEARNVIQNERIRVPVTQYTVEPLIPDDTDEFYRYDGSLTTPPCSESVIWTVMKETVAISKAQVEQLNKIHLSHGESNYRPVQPLNDRRVLLLSTELPVADFSSFSPPSFRPISFVALLAALFAVMYY